MNPFRRKCPYLDTCNQSVEKDHYNSHCRPIILGEWFWCDEYRKLKQMQSEQNKRTPQEWNDNNEIKPVQLPSQPKVKKSSKYKKRPKDWFNPSRRVYR